MLDGLLDKPLSGIGQVMFFREMKTQVDMITEQTSFEPLHVKKVIVDLMQMPEVQENIKLLRKQLKTKQFKNSMTLRSHS